MGTHWEHLFNNLVYHHSTRTVCVEFLMMEKKWPPLGPFFCVMTVPFGGAPETGIVPTGGVGGAVLTPHR